MELMNMECTAVVESAGVESTQSSLVELLDLELSLIGGGMGDVIQ